MTSAGPKTHTRAQGRHPMRWYWKHLHWHTHTHTANHTNTHNQNVDTHRLHFCWFWRYDTHLVTVCRLYAPLLLLASLPFPSCFSPAFTPPRIDHAPTDIVHLRSSFYAATIPVHIRSRPCQTKSVQILVLTSQLTSGFQRGGAILPSAGQLRSKYERGIGIFEMH